MIIPKLAYKNIIGAGLRTWLNVIVLSFSFVAIIWTQGLYEGMSEQATTAMIEEEIGGGQIWQKNYDPYDPLTLNDSHAELPAAIQNWIDQGSATAVLIHQATIYPEGRLQSILIKGINADQKILNLPTEHMQADTSSVLPAMIGQRMARKIGLQKGNWITMRWRDANGTFDAAEIYIAHVMKTAVSGIDNGQIWLPLKKVRRMLKMPQQATMVVLSRKFNPDEVPDGWLFKSQESLLQELRAMVQAKSIGATILYAVLLFLAMLAIFDTQILSVFRRRKEMGTMMALGMTRKKIISLFTLEGAIHGVLAGLVATLYGLPLCIYFNVYGLPLPEFADNYGFALSEKLFPVYSAGLIFGTTVLILVVVTIVSYLPTRKISRLKPTDALRGKMS